MDNDFEVDFQEHQRGDIAVEDLDAALIAVRKAEEVHDKVNEEKKKLYKDMEEKKQKFISLLVASGKKRWEVKGYKGFTMFEELKFRVPDSFEAKADFFKFLKSPKVCSLLKQTPENIFLTYATVHSGKLNTLCKDLKELAANEGEDLQIAGIAAPKSENKLRSLSKVK